ncbi:MAG: 30S ribosomal protein S15 [Candidatus Wolfebacteria bacterium GW2011_GWC1_43_10]|uniref:Small ribosomal subunit protein uS15 n=1 Tax=Candidatus Wolfebacteria bacterium GW2011_GWC1_43_10 TaxID=1619011 RepID=A0A0G1EJ40_9BACT|nr:MAG: 30S ribosomal protein S15 [Candidatus Wolfebacteria bacterium GW2011_GWC1_43_10]KKT23103.1 MAG: 30S ribosomal protein S15 [Parcubacteria group bacterium GW2011_GWB1_43_8b]
MLTPRKKQNIVKELGTHGSDTGSAQVQIGLISKQVDELTKHLKSHPKDNSSRKGLLKMVSKRRKLLDYLAKNEEKIYAKVLKKLGLKK